MIPTTRSIFTLGALVFLAAPLCRASAPGAESIPIPILFEKSKELSSDVRFVARNPLFTLFLLSDGAYLAPAKRSAEAPTQGLSMRFSRARQPRSVTGVDAQPATLSRFLGDDPSKWTVGESLFGEVRYDEVYPGIDVAYHGARGGLEFDFIVEPGADPTPIGFRLDGADRLRVSEEGDLVASLATGDVKLERPISYQRIGGQRVEVESAFRLQEDGEVRIDLQAYDPAAELVIDPAIEFSSYFGGPGLEWARDVAVGDYGIYITGATTSDSFYGENVGGDQDCFVMRLSSDGRSLLNVALIGSNNPGFEWCYTIAVDPTTDFIHVAGHSSAAGFPLVFPAQSANAGGADVTYFRLSRDLARLLASTYWGGSGYDSPRGVTMDADGNPYVVGETSSSDFPTTSGVVQGSDPSSGNKDGFLVSFGRQPFFVPVRFSTYLGGKGGDTVLHGVGIDPSGAVLVAGGTTSASYPTRNAFQPRLAGGKDIVISRLTSSGNGYFYSTFLGGPDDEEALDLAPYSTGTPVVVGYTRSGRYFPWVSSLQRAPDGAKWSLALKFDWRYGPLFSTSWGKGEARSVALDKANRIHFAGSANSNLPVRYPILTSGEGYLAKLSSTGTYTYYSTAWSHEIYGVATDNDRLYGVGTAGASSMPLVSPFDPGAGPSGNSFVVGIR